MRHLKLEGRDDFNAVWYALKGLERGNVPEAPAAAREAAQRVRERLEATPDMTGWADRAAADMGTQARCEARVPDLSGTTRSGLRVCGVPLTAPGGRCPAVEHHAGT